MTLSRSKYGFDSRWEYLKLSCGAKVARVVLAHKIDVRVISGQPCLCGAIGRHNWLKISFNWEFDSLHRYHIIRWCNGSTYGFEPYNTCSSHVRIAMPLWWNWQYIRDLKSRAWKGVSVRVRLEALQVWNLAKNSLWTSKTLFSQYDKEFVKFIEIT